MPFNIDTKDVIYIKDQPKKGNCRFRGKIHFSEGYHNLFQSKFHQDRSTLHIIAAVLEKYPGGAYFKLNITFNDINLILMEKKNDVYIFLESETLI